VVLGDVDGFRIVASFSELKGKPIVIGESDPEGLEVKSSGEVGLDTILAKGVRSAPDVAALAALDGNIVSILIWHYHDDDIPGPDANVALDLSGLAAPAGRVLMHHYRVDRHHSNAYEAWKQMGSPQHPATDQYVNLERSSRLALLDSPEWMRAEGGMLKVRLTLPRQAVSLLRFELRQAPAEDPKGS